MSARSAIMLALKHSVPSLDKDKLYSSSSFSNIIPTVDVQDKAIKDKDNCNIELLVLDTVPKRCKSQAAKILSYIKKHPDITWSLKGELTLKGSVLPNTHMVDLINALLWKRISKPNGWKQFSTVLKDIPYKFIDKSDYRPLEKSVWEPY